MLLCHTAAAGVSLFCVQTSEREPSWTLCMWRRLSHKSHWSIVSILAHSGTATPYVLPLSKSSQTSFLCMLLLLFTRTGLSPIGVQRLRMIFFSTRPHYCEFDLARPRPTLRHSVSFDGAERKDGRPWPAFTQSFWIMRLARGYHDFQVMVILALKR